MAKDTISAGEIEKYGYCPLSWWLGRKKREETEPERRGTEEHEVILREIDELRQKETGAKEYERLVIWYALAATVIAITGLSAFAIQLSIKATEILAVIALIWILAAVFFLYKSTTSKDGSSLRYGQIVIIFSIVAIVIAVNMITTSFIDAKMAQIILGISVVWLVASTFALYFVLRWIRVAKELRAKHKVRGDVVYADIPADGRGRTQLFVSEKYGLSGRPDYILEKDGEKIPVDIKTGRIPRGPLFSHILQVGAYCILMEDEFGKAPPYGLLKYGENVQEIDYNAELKGLVLEKLSMMKEALKTSNVHRNHNRVGKCRTCSKRKECPEKLA